MTTKGKMSKREIQYELKRIHEERIEEIKTKATAEWEADESRRTTAADTYKLIKEWEEITQDAKDGYALELWLQKQSDLLKKRAEIKKELIQEINEQ